MINKINWQKHHRFQKISGWCGPAILHIALLANGINISQAKIAQAVYDAEWGTPPFKIQQFLNKFFLIVNHRIKAKIDDIVDLLNQGMIVIVNWWDNMDDTPADGHYSIVTDYDHKLKRLKLVDPSGARKGIWWINEKEFIKRWYDFLDNHQKHKLHGWLLWFDPKSKKLSKHY